MLLGEVVCDVIRTGGPIGAERWCGVISKEGGGPIGAEHWCDVICGGGPIGAARWCLEDADAELQLAE